ncbi:MAG: AMP-binding protein [Myxococcales bacterium]|nr:AMP-binding protein [Myxococcales bacterium]
MVDGGASRDVSAQQLLDDSRRLAASLRRLGLGPGDPIATISRNRLELVVAYHAVLCIGGVLVPLLDQLSPREVAQRLRHCRARAVIAERGAGSLLGEIDAEDLESVAHVIDIDGSEPTTRKNTIAYRSLVNTVEGCQPVARARDDLACIIYTGATTSNVAKGVMLTHHNLISNVRNNAALGRKHMDFFAAPLAHSFGFGVLLSTYASGSTLVILDEFRPERLMQLIERYRITRVGGVPAMLVSMTEHPAAARYDLSSVRVWGVGGAPMTEASVQRLLGRFGGRLERGYGLTEASPTVARTDLEREEVPESCGRPLPGVQVRIVDPRSGEPRALGEVGEVCVRGDNISPGYYALPDETARVFREGWLHTGDLGRFDDDGNLFIVGRSSDLIIQAGFNVYPSEVEAVLAGHPSVQRAAVVGVPDTLVGERVAAFVVGDADDEPRLRDRCEQLLAPYKVPTAYFFVDELPLTSVGKIDKKALRARLAETHVKEGADHAAVRHAPRQQRRELLERALCEAFRRVLGGEQRVSVDDDFFELGGRSLQLTQLVGWVRESLGAELALRTFFEAPSPRALAEVIDARLDDEGSSHSPAASSAVDSRFEQSGLTNAQVEYVLERCAGHEVEDIYTLTASQQDALQPLLDDDGEVQAAQLSDTLLRMELWIDGELDARALRACWQRIVARHAALRTRLLQGKLPHPVQVVYRDHPAPWNEIDIRDLPRERQLDVIAETNGRCTPELPPWVDAQLFRLGERDHRWVLHYHIGVVDGISLSVIRQELLAEYGAWHRRETAQIQPARPFVDYIAWQRRQPLDAVERFWQPHGVKIGGWSRLDLTHAGGDVRFTFAASAFEVLKELASELRLPLSIVLLGGWAITVTEHLGVDAATIALMDSGRNAPVRGVESMVGSFSHQLPVHARIDDEASVRDWLYSLQLQLADMQTYEHALTRERMRSLWGGGDRELPYDFGLNVQYLRRVEHELARDLPVQMDPSTRLTLRNSDGWCVVPLNLSVWMAEAEVPRITGTFAYEVSRFSHDEVEEIGRAYIRALEALTGCDSIGEVRADMREAS